MESWGNLKKIVGKAENESSDKYVDEFYSAAESSCEKLKKLQSTIQNFVQVHLAKKHRIAIVTSGSTTVQLDSCNLFHIDSVGTGNRGAAFAEGLLRRGYAVIYIYRDGSLLPYSRNFAKSIHNGKFMDLLKLKTDDDKVDIVVETDTAQKTTFQKLYEEYTESKERIIDVPFETVQEYLYVLKIATMELDAAKHRGLLFLAASVMDFYIPNKMLKKQGLNGNDLELSFQKVPNVLRKIRKVWCKHAFVITFKLDVDDIATRENAYKDLEKYGPNVIVGNTLESRQETLALITEWEELTLRRPVNGIVETPLVDNIVRLHREYFQQQRILRRSKELLLLSAKFCMMKENDILNEDAHGTKNVQFTSGVTIKSSRMENAPKYTLKSIYKNKSHSARGHVWQNVSSGNAPEILVIFSPAGTPDTIGSFWGDFWSGWADKEITEFKSEISNITLQSAISVVSAPLTGDFSSANAALQYMWSKIGAAWSDGEQTRIRQSLQNLLSLSLWRGLKKLDDLHTVDEIAPDEFQPLARNDTMTKEEAIDICSSTAVQNEAGDSSDDDVLTENDNDVALEKLKKVAENVQVHATISDQIDDMRNDGMIDELISYMKDGASINIAGYSMGGMLSQLCMLRLGEEAAANGLDTKKLNMIGFGTPRVGDIGFVSRMKLLFSQSQLISVMHPSDTVHAFPPTAEGYQDALLKIFLKDDGLEMGRRSPSLFSMLPTTRSMDKVYERIFHSSPNATKCTFCESATHGTEQHRCRYCTQRGNHRGTDCPNRDKPCGLCGKCNHCTGAHICKVCSQHGHRGRHCHLQRDVGAVELIAYFRFHDFLYYNALLKKSVEFSTQ